MLNEQKAYFILEIIVCLLCIGIGIGFFFNKNQNGLETTFSALGIVAVYLLMFFFVLNDTVLEDYDVTNKILVGLFYILSLGVIALMPVLSKVPYKELFEVTGEDELVHPIVLSMIIAGSYVLCYPIVHHFTKEHNCLLQMLIKPGCPLVIPGFPILLIAIAIKRKNDNYVPNEFNDSFGSDDSEEDEYDTYPEEKEYLVDEYGREEEIDGHCGFSVHTSSGWHDENDDGTYN